jgi:hypothetical protein
MENLSEMSDYIGPALEPALQPGADQPLDERSGEGHEEKEAQQIGEEAGGEKEHPAREDHGPIQQLGGGQPSLRQFGLDAAHCLETLSADQPGPRKTDGKEQKNRRQRTDNLAGLDDEVDLDDRDYSKEDEQADEHWRTSLTMDSLLIGRVG